ncbi:MAG TPA: lipid-A-disaccharide synthase [Terriglobales bacterium]|nr:lipid-A-disaccharide synthase [Terriglobales bacterium]
MRILISAGEASGEMYGAQLIEALRGTLRFGQPRAAVPTQTQMDSPVPTQNQTSSDFSTTLELADSTIVSGEGARATPPRVEFFGVGGERMRASGCDIVVDAKDLSVVGITEILSHLPKIWGLFHKLVTEADRRRPDLAVVIDSPAFNWRVARQMKKRGVPVVYYVCPQFWAWRQGRVRLLRKYVDKALVIFPFEEKFYCDRGVNAEFVGHPLAELPRPTISRDRYAAEHGLNVSKLWITLMPGSRNKEVRMNLPGILEAAALLGSEYEFLIPVAPTVGSSSIQHIMHSHPLLATSARSGAPPFSENAVHLVPDALPALAHSRAGIIASGTATVEAAMMETPFVMVYRVTPLTYLLGRWTVKVPHFAMVNLIAGEEVVSELVQQDFTGERVAAELKRIIPDGAAREKMIEGLQRVKRVMRGNVEGNAPEHAARAIAQLLAVGTSEAANS